MKRKAEKTDEKEGEKKPKSQFSQFCNVLTKSLATGESSSQVEAKIASIYGETKTNEILKVADELTAICSRPTTLRVERLPGPDKPAETKKGELPDAEVYDAWKGLPDAWRKSDMNYNEWDKLDSSFMLNLVFPAYWSKETVEQRSKKMGMDESTQKSFLRLANTFHRFRYRFFCWKTYTFFYSIQCDEMARKKRTESTIPFMDNILYQWSRLTPCKVKKNLFL